MVDYAALKGRIVEVYGTRKAFAENVGMSLPAVTKRLNGATELKAREISTWAKALDIEGEIARYFFCLKA